MKFISNYLQNVSAKSKVDALKAIGDAFDYPDFKIYWESNNPIGIPFPSSRRAFRMYSVNSKMGRALVEQKKIYGAHLY